MRELVKDAYVGTLWGIVAFVWLMILGNAGAFLWGVFGG